MGTRGWQLCSIVLISAIMPVACGRAGDPTTADDPSGNAPTFAGVLTCPDGEDAGGAGWDYGADPEGFVDDPVAWVRDNARGLEIDLTLSFLESAGDREEVVIATRQDGVVLAFVDFGQDPAGAYFPNEAEACPSSGIEDFNQS
jgi:hypothetical protein